MTREEAIDVVESFRNVVARMENTEYTVEALDMSLSALRPVSREQVEKVWRGEWDYPTCEWNLPKCPKCGCNSKDAMYGHKSNFCPRCGEAMTDEAVQMVMERLEALKDGKGD